MIAYYVLLIFYFQVQLVVFLCRFYFLEYELWNKAYVRLYDVITY